MIKRIYHTDSLRCRLKTTGYKNQIELQLQRKVFWFLWINCFPWMHVSEGFWGERRGGMVLTDSYQYGNKCEVYATGTLDINKRVAALFDEYIKSKNEKDLSLEKLAAL